MGSLEKADVILAGGGIIGLSTALELAQAGLRVTVIEQGRAMREASWAAAGMLAAHDPENPPVLGALSELSLRLYPEFLERVEGLSGLRVPLRTRQTLQGSRRGGFDAPPAHGRAAADATKLLPELRGEEREFLLLEEDSLDPRDLCAALPLAARAAGVRLLEETAVTAVGAGSGGVAISTSAGALNAGAFVNCCGAWAGKMPGGGGPAAEQLPASEALTTEPLPHEPLPLEPRKGQILTVRLDDWRPLGCVLRTPETYLVPRGDGRVVIGATLERAGFDKAVDEQVIAALLEEACALWPPLRAARVVETWAGLRPGSADGLPVMGPAGAPNCWIAAGHFRNGILLAPATARLIKQLIAGEAPAVAVEAFDAARFRGAAPKIQPPEASRHEKS